MLVSLLPHVPHMPHMYPTSYLPPRTSHLPTELEIYLIAPHPQPTDPIHSAGAAAADPGEMGMSLGSSDAPAKAADAGEEYMYTFKIELPGKLLEVSVGCRRGGSTGSWHGGAMRWWPGGRIQNSICFWEE